MILLFPGRSWISGRAWAVIIALTAATGGGLAAHKLGRLWAWALWSAERALERLGQDRDRLAAEAVVRGREAHAQAEQVRRVETAHRRATRLTDLTEPYIQQSRSAADASQPLDPDRADRLRGHDHGLCRSTGAACFTAPSAPADPARAGGAPMRPVGSSAESDVG